jgi:hypothetical protein
MNIVCEHCGALVAIRADEPLSRVARDAADGEPKSFVITTRDATGSRLLHRCVLVDDRVRS